MESDHAPKAWSWDQVSITWCTPPVGGQGARVLLFAAYAASYRRLLCDGGLNVGEVLEKAALHCARLALTGLILGPIAPWKQGGALPNFPWKQGGALPDFHSGNKGGCSRNFPGTVFGDQISVKTRVNYGLFDPAKSAKVAGTLGLHLSIPMIRALSMSSIAFCGAVTSWV